jgi:hypothetical protein
VRLVINNIALLSNLLAQKSPGVDMDLDPDLGPDLDITKDDLSSYWVGYFDYICGLYVVVTYCKYMYKNRTLFD